MIHCKGDHSFLEEIDKFLTIIRANYPASGGAWCVLNGLKLMIQKPGDESIQIHTAMNGYIIIFLYLCYCALGAHHPGPWYVHGNTAGK